jgi:large subunit ribosomal protein L30
MQKLKKIKRLPKMSEMIAAVRVRGITGVRYDVQETMKFLNLHRKNFCVVLEKTSSVIGMLNKAKDYLTWGEVNQETIDMLKKRDEGKKFFRLNSPRKGFGRKGIKKPFGIGGALGNRGEKMNDLVRRML